MKSECRGCLKVFRSVNEFDRHRTGDYDNHRRCMTTEEMYEKGWKFQDPYWQSPKAAKNSERLAKMFNEQEGV
mgnify:CR=1 FL=1